MSDVSCISSFQCNWTEIPESVVPEDLCHFKAPAPNDSLEPLAAWQHNAHITTPLPAGQWLAPGPSAHQSGRLRLPPGRAGGSAADMSLTSSD